MRISFLLLFLSVASLSWAQSNPPAPGFDAEGSDAKAIALADAVMQAQGGRAAWDATRYLSWNFLGRRTLLWDRHTGRVRIEVPQDSLVYLVNVWTGEGMAAKAGVEITDSEAKAKALSRAKSIWINDSYWLVMPFKLKDTGVTLTYVGTQNTLAGNPAEVVQLQFKEVGDTPENKYWVYIDPTTKRVVQWDYYAEATNEDPNFQLPWTGYAQYGSIWLAGDHGDYHLTEIAAPTTVPDARFTEW